MLSLVLDPIFHMSVITVATLIYIAAIPGSRREQEHWP
jgi:hypothetical protein